MRDEIIKKETSIVAKEKGFDLHCKFIYLRFFSGNEGYNLVKRQLLISLGDNESGINVIDFFEAPTQTLLARWIRKIYGIHIEIYCNASGFGYILTKLNGTIIKEIENDIFFESNEDALEVGLVLALNEKKMV